jgi:hypothetical protein
VIHRARNAFPPVDLKQIKSISGLKTEKLLDSFRLLKYSQDLGRIIFLLDFGQEKLKTDDGRQRTWFEASYHYAPIFAVPFE